VAFQVIIHFLIKKMQPKLIIHLMGPTASGKTDVAIALARVLPIEIISVDSALIYQGLDIGSAKPSAALRAQIPHHLIDLVSPEVAYSAAHFVRDAKQAIAEIAGRGKVPLLVGGTMFYFKALLEGLADIPAVPPDIRQAVQQDYAQQGALALFQHLQQIDPVAASRIHAHDSQRVCRALEVYRATGQSLTDWLQAARLAILPQQNRVQISLLPTDRASLHQILAQRFDAMLAAGFIAEVQNLQACYALHADLPAMRCVGYRQVWQYLAGFWGFAEMRKAAIAASRQLAKRQLTWLKSWKNHTVVPAHQDNTVEQVHNIILPYLLAAR
jgi:tRNA dimethylallyltransferase